MAGETILVVDDAPVNLKLTDILLRKAGYKVHTVSDAEEALRVLRSVQPNVMLVDIQLPGMNGLELTRLVKGDPHTSDMIVIALTACAMREDQDKALAAGCDGFITKPIDTHTLGASIREHLNARPASQVPAVPVTTLPGGMELSTVEMESLRRRFLEDGVLQSRRLLEAGMDIDCDAARTQFHKWIGGAGALGYGDISALARELDDILADTALQPEKLRERLQQLVLAFSDPRESGISLPDSIMKELAGKRVAMVGFAEAEAERLTSVFEYMGVLPRAFDANEQSQAQLVQNCDVVMVHVRPETMDAAWLDRRIAPPAERPLILVGGREAILALDPAVQARAREFLIDGWQPEEAVMRLCFALTRVTVPQLQYSQAAVHGAGRTSARTMDSATVVLADDDPTVSAVMCAMLREHNVDCRVVSSGDEALRMVQTCRPAAVVLDVNMPGMSGFEVLAAIRRKDLPVRVILLTARSHEKDVVHGFDLGADDYVLKPFNAMEVVVRLKRLLCA